MDPAVSIQSSSPFLQIPAEILYEILGDIVADYIHDAIFNLEPIPDDVVDQSGDTVEQLPANTVQPLLQVSFQFRDTTLKILSDAFVTERDEAGSLVTNPFQYLLPIRKVYRASQSYTGTLPPHLRTLKYHKSSPLLLAYIGLSTANVHLRVLTRCERVDMQETEIYVTSVMSRIASGLSASLRVGQPVLRDRIYSAATDFMEFAFTVCHLWIVNESLERGLNDYGGTLSNGERSTVVDALDNALSELEKCEREYPLRFHQMTRGDFRFPTFKLTGRMLEEANVMKTLAQVANVQIHRDDHREIPGRAQGLINGWRPLFMEA